MNRLFSLAFVWISTALLLAIPAVSQQLPSGMVDDPAEYLPQPWWRSEAHLDVRAGTSLIGPTWYATTRMALSMSSRPFSANLQGTLRSTVTGLYEEDFNEWYDLLRLIQFARYDPGLQNPLFARIGPIRHMRLGHGHLVDLYRSDLAWDDRTIGAEVQAASPFGRLTIFSNDVRFTGLTGGRLSTQPFALAGEPVLSTLTVGGELATSHVLQQGNSRERQTAFSADVRATVLDIGGIGLVPYGGYSSFLREGRGFHAGLSVEADNIIDLVRFHLRFAYHRNSEGFIPGYFGTFYQINNPRARLLHGDAYFADEGISNNATDGSPEVVGVPLSEISSGNNLESELRVLLFNQFEFRSRFLRHYGPERLSTFNIRLFYRVTEQMRLDIAFARTGLGSVFSLFRPLDDQSALSFQAAYQILPGTWVFADAAYTYERITEDDAGTRLYVAQRRFEPMGGLRFTF